MKDIIFEVRNPSVNTEEKIKTILEVLAKATGRNIEYASHDDDNSPSEPTPYLCVRELADEVYAPVQRRLWQFYSLILSKWLRSDLDKASDQYKLNGKIYINPKTGKYLTKKEWAEIQKDLNRIFKWLYNGTTEGIVNKALATGKILHSMEPDARMDASLKDMDIKGALGAVNADTQFKHVVDFADVHTGELIQDVTERSRKAIVRVIMQGYQDRVSTKELEDNLFEAFSVMNRDWRRIAETETATNFNNGYLIAELKENSKDGEPVFMQGISGGGACGFCSTEVNNRIVVLLDGPPKTGGDDVVIKGQTFKAIWPGKNNFGRKRAQWWIAAGTQHPHCRCNWIRMPDVTDEYISRLRDAMKS